ncbi:MAG: hypothetical protein JZU55_05885, partial [Afipia sp.]|nr:hypothetical protein [Afipia sp.]
MVLAACACRNRHRPHDNFAKRLRACAVDGGVADQITLADFSAFDDPLHAFAAPAGDKGGDDRIGDVSQIGRCADVLFQPPDVSQDGIDILRVL